MTRDLDTYADQADNQEGEHSWLGAYLTARNVALMSAQLSGGGDEGQLDHIDFYDGNDKLLSEFDITENLRSMTIFDGSSHPRSFFDELSAVIDTFAEPLGDYVNNEGGVVSVDIRVTPDGLLYESGYFTENEPDEDYDYDEDYDAELEEDSNESMEP